MTINRREFIKIQAIAAAATLMLIGVLASCVQAPASQNAIGVPQSVAPKGSGYKPDVVPTDLPDEPVASEDPQTVTAEEPSFFDSSCGG